ncbi:MAG: MFS transporter [Actinomyces sp.]|uniref:MFS transporter n=1 Tax=Actinomyces sp. TaxID=29317 RepID=UPI0026DA7EA0|nr:MFS transporter [Actinomyces sp.]MDO4243100.1 MFS transporter [Actinomyces sp.]
MTHHGRLAASWAATRRSAYGAFVVQAIVNNLAPLLFVVFHSRIGIGVAQLGLLAFLNFLVQLVTDLVSIRLVDRVGYRPMMVIAHVLAAAGLMALALVPSLLGSGLVGLCLAVVVYAVGGGLIEVLASPIVEHLPAEPGRSKEAGMALLHSFYCWGQLAVVLGTTGLLAVVGIERWWVLPLVWSLVPIVNGLVIARVPMPRTVPDDERTSLRSLLGAPAFLLALALMALGGASELTMSQWSSFFAQQGAGVGKELGDLLGPGLFALLMAIGRTGYGLLGERIQLRGVLIVSGLGAAACYVVAAAASHAGVTLLACALTGLCVSLMWPGATSLTAARFPAGGGAMFAVIALFGDVGAAVGPAAAGVLAQSASAGGSLAGLVAVLPTDSGTGLRPALLLCAVIPLLYSAVVALLGARRRVGRSAR